MRGQFWEDLTGFLRRMDKDLQELINQAALRAYAYQQSARPEIQAWIAEAEERVTSGEGFPDALPAEEFIARARERAEAIRLRDAS